MNIVIFYSIIRGVGIENQKTTSEEMAFGASTGTCTELINRIHSVAISCILSRGYVDNCQISQGAVEMPGLEPGRHELISSATHPAIPTAH